MTGDRATPLAGLRVGISGAVPERSAWGNHVALDRMILRFVSKLAGLVMDLGGTVVHGSQPELTPILAEQVRLRAHADAEPALLELVVSDLFAHRMDHIWSAGARARVVVVPKVTQLASDEVGARNDSLTAMRLVLLHQVHVVIAIGGKLHVGTGANPGVLEELAIARWRNVPCYVVSALGGASDAIGSELLDELGAGNLLAPELGALLAAASDHADAFVGDLVLNLYRHREELMSAPRNFCDLRWSDRAGAPLASIDEELRFGAMVAEPPLPVILETRARVRELLQFLSGEDLLRALDLLRHPPRPPSTSLST